MTEREQTLRRTCLEHLANIPAGYTTSEKAVCSYVYLAVAPEATTTETQATLARLEADRLAACVVNALGEKRWSITTAGRAALNE